MSFLHGLFTGMVAAGMALHIGVTEPAAWFVFVGVSGLASFNRPQ